MLLSVYCQDRGFFFNAFCIFPHNIYLRLRMDQNSTKKMLILQLMDPREEELLGDRTKENPRTKKKSVQFKTTKLRVLSVLISVLSFYPNLSLCNWILVRGWGKWQLWSYVGRGNWFKAARKFIFLLFRMQTDTIGVKGYYRNHCHSDESLTAATVNINGFGNWGMFHISRELGQI